MFLRTHRQTCVVLSVPWAWVAYVMQCVVHVVFPLNSLCSVLARHQGFRSSRPVPLMQNWQAPMEHRWRLCELPRRFAAIHNSRISCHYSVPATQAHTRRWKWPESLSLLAL